jgi:hypothetical protein
MVQVLSGYLYYVQGTWQLPLFHVSALGTPPGTNVIFMDVVPIVALVGKLIHSLTGAAINPYGAYLFLCFVLPGVMMTLVLIAANIRYALAAIVAAAFANATPALLWRWGHIASSAHFLLIGALALYLLSLQKRSWRGLATAWIGYLAFVFLTNVYLFAMVGTVWLCAIVQRHLSGLATTRQVLGIGALTIALVSAIMAFGGQFSPGNPLPITPDYGQYTMNVASPFVPQSSGLFPWHSVDKLLSLPGGRRKVIDATGGQYEGFNYLGLGLLFASLIVLPIEVAWLRNNLKRHVVLFVALAALTAFAISHRVFVGHWQLFDLPLPDYLALLFGIYRGSGRFFWLICYAQLAVVLVLGFRSSRPVIAACLVGAAIIQLFDVQPLRKQIIASLGHRAGAPALNPGQVVRLTAGARYIDVVPSFQCSDVDRVLQANIELMLAAARANVPTNTVYLARDTYGVTWRDVLREPSRAEEMVRSRRDDYCEKEIEKARSGGGPGDVLVLLSKQPRPGEIVPGVTCSPLSWARYCQRVHEPREK